MLKFSLADQHGAALPLNFLVAMQRIIVIVLGHQTRLEEVAQSMVVRTETLGNKTYPWKEHLTSLSPHTICTLKTNQLIIASKVAGQIRRT